MKDFGAEVRASMDVDQFLQQAVLLLDITETSVEGIVDRMLRKVRTYQSFIYPLLSILPTSPTKNEKQQRTHLHLIVIKTNAK